MSIILEIPESIAERLRKRALSEEKTLEELSLEALLIQAGLEDPETEAEMHLSLSKKYLREAEELLAKKEWVQASEKGWGAASQMVKAVAARRGRRLKSYSQLNEYVDELTEEMKEPELDRFWSAATSLHQNFYESWLPPRSVMRRIDDVKKLIDRLSKLLI